MRAMRTVPAWIKGGALSVSSAKVRQTGYWELLACGYSHPAGSSDPLSAQSGKVAAHAEVKQGGKESPLGVLHMPGYHVKTIEPVAV